MALTRKMLKGMGLNEEQIDTIIEGHDETVSALKSERDDYKAKAAAAEALKEERDGLKQQIEEAKGGTDWKAEYEKLKTDTEAKETAAKVHSAYRKLLTEAKVNPRDLDLIMSATDFSGMKLDRDGKLRDAEGLSEAIREKYSDRIVSEGRKGSDVKTPPAKGRSGMTRDEIMAIPDATARQRAIAENHGLFGF